MRIALFTVTVLLATGCGSNPENSASCGFASIAGASMTAQQLRNRHAWLNVPPSDLKSVVAARVVGFGTARALVAHGTDGLVLGYEGQGFPTRPGFGILLVDDSSEVTKGLLIFDKEEQDGIPKLGTISGSTSTIPIYGLRVNWSGVSDPRCPMFAKLNPDSAPRP
ncbi:MAG: hypothetical protein EXR93_06095 [Gemmatimonadetes bacterium]|nr:hypothetical protein [Gemmatimonadota bacterium]